MSAYEEWQDLDALKLFKKWATEQGLDYSNDDGSRLLRDFFKWGREHRELFNYKVEYVEAPLRKKQVLECVDKLKELAKSNNVAEEDFSVKEDDYGISVHIKEDYFCVSNEKEAKLLIEALQGECALEISATYDGRFELCFGYGETSVPIRVTKGEPKK